MGSNSSFRTLDGKKFEEFYKYLPWSTQFNSSHLKVSTWCSLSSFVGLSLPDINLNWGAFIFPMSYILFVLSTSVIHYYFIKKSKLSLRKNKKRIHRKTKKNKPTERGAKLQKGALFKQDKIKRIVIKKISTSKPKEA